MIKQLSSLLLLSLTLLQLPAAMAQSSLGQVSSFSRQGSQVTLQCSHGQLVVSQCARHAWKVSSLPTGLTLADERRSVALTHTYDDVAEVSATETAGQILITNGFSTVSIDKATALLSFADGDAVRLTEQTGIDNSQGYKTITFAPQGDNSFYGGGYNGVNTNLEGKMLTMNNTQNYNWSQEIGEGCANNICVPLVVSDLGYGILFEDHYIDGIIRPSATLGTTFESESPTPISYVYLGSEQGNMAGVMQTYGEVTGLHELPPYWSLGYITSRYGYHSQEETEGVIAQLEAKQMPVSGVVLDLFWEGETQSGMGNLDWYRPMWPSAETMMSDFRSKGIHTIIITEPYFAEESANYQTLLEQGLFVDPACPNMSWVSFNKVGLIDFLNPQAIDWMWDFYRARTDEGVDGWWLDLGEPEMVHDDAIHADGSTVMQAHNEFGISWIAGVWNKWKQTYPDQRPLFLPRSGTSGMQRYATFPWTGDIARSWSGFRAQVPALVNGGMSGLGYLSSDIGGFVTDASNTTQTGVALVDENLYLRWFQMGVFTPVLRTHSQYNPEPYNEDYRHIETQIRDLMNLRYRMLPYNYSSAWLNATVGAPITMPIDFYSAEPNASTRLTDEYLFGPNILVAPIMDSASISRDVYLPSGQWIDPATLQRYAGGQTVAFSSADYRLPYYYRCGTFTPLFTQRTFTNTELIDNTELDVFYPISEDGSQPVPFTLYDDDHTSVSVGSRYETITFAGQEGADVHTVSIVGQCEAAYEGRPDHRTLHFIIPMGETEAASASVTGDVVRAWADSETNTLYVDASLPTSSTQSSCEFSIAYGTTGISTIAQPVSRQSELYNLSGLRISQPASHGIYIRDGKIVMGK